MSPLRSEISPSCLHQANDSNYSPYQEFGNTDCHLSRRHSHPTSISQRSTVYLQEDCDPPRAFGIPHQLEQMFATPFPATYLPGNIAQHGHNVSVLAEREAGSHPTGSTPATYQRQRYTTGVSYTPGTHEPCSSEWHLAGPSAQPSSSEGSFSWNSKIGLQEFEAVPRPVTGGYEGPGMVAVPGTPGHQCSTPQMPTIRSGHSHRCIPIGLGGHGGQHLYRRSLEPRGVSATYQRARAQSSVSCRPGFRKESETTTSSYSLAHGQHHSGGLSQQEGGGGTRSPSLSAIALELWSLVLKIRSWVTATHIPGILNVDADTASHQFNPRVEWTLDPSIFRKIVYRFYLPEVDLFASRLSHQVERCVSRYPDPGAIAVDAFLQDWRKWKSIIHPPVNLLLRVVKKIQDEGASALVVAPNWPNMPWYPQLAQMLVDYPLYLPASRYLLYLPFDLQAHHPLWATLNLTVWPVSGDVSRQQVFCQTLSKSSCLHGVSPQRRDMLPLGGLALNGVPCVGGVPFQHL